MAPVKNAEILKSTTREVEPYFEGLSGNQIALLRKRSCPQMFAIVSWGCAATQWIAAVLNRHPDIFCTHQANYVWHVLGECEKLDGLRYLRVIGSQGCSCVAAGDVHGVSRHHIPELRRVFADQFNAAVVVREPMPRLHSQMALFETTKMRNHWDLAYVDEVISRAGVTLPSASDRCRFFVHAANMLNAILEEIAVGKVYRAEDLTRNADTLGDLVQEITRGKVSPSAEWLRSEIDTPPINAHATERHHGAFEDWQVDVIRKVVSPRSWEIYESLGYRAVEFAT